MTQKPSQTKDLTACTGNPVPTDKSWDAGDGLETKEERDILSDHSSISFKEEVDESLIEEINLIQISLESIISTELSINGRI